MSIRVLSSTFDSGGPLASFGDNGQIVMHDRMACQDMVLTYPTLSCHAHVTSVGKFDGVPQMSNVQIWLPPPPLKLRNGKKCKHWPVERERSLARDRKGKEGESAQEL